MLFTRVAVASAALLVSISSATAQPVDGGPPGYLGLTGDNALQGDGIEVLALVEGGPAAMALFRVGDVIHRINGKPVRTVQELAQQLIGIQTGQEAHFEVKRGLNLYELTARLTRRPVAETAPPVEPKPQPRGEAMLGVMATSIDAFTAARLGVEHGAVIDQVVPNSPAGQARLPVGGVVVAVDDTPVKTPEGFRSIIKAHRAGETVTLQYYEGIALRRARITLGESAPTLQKPPVDLSRDELLRELQSMRAELEGLQQRLDEIQLRLHP